MTRPLSEADLRALIGLLATVEAHIQAGDLTQELAVSLASRMHRDGVASSDDPGLSLRQGLNDMNHRIRYALGEYDTPPSPVPLSD